MFLFSIGEQASLALNSSGLGFISFLQRPPIMKTDLMIAFKEFALYLPLVMR